MEYITAALGPIEPAELGLASMHEHVMFDGSARWRRLLGRQQLPPHAFPIDERDLVSLENIGILHRNVFLARDALKQCDEAALLAEVADFKAAGGDALLELSVPGVRADKGEARRISAATGVHIILSTGFHAAKSWPAGLRGLGVAGYHKLMMREITQGVEDAGCRPGHIAIFFSALEADEEHALRAAARASHDSRLSLTINPYAYAYPCAKAGEDGDWPHLLEILKQEGMDLSRAIFANVPLVDRPPFSEAIRHPERYRVNTETAKYLLNQGVNISVEFANAAGSELLGDYDAGDWAQLSGLVELISQGYAGQIVLGSNCCGKTMLKRFGGEGYCRLLYYTLPMLRDTAGVSDHALRRMLYGNPARLLAAAGCNHSGMLH